jgi:hypothetical protein
MQMPVPARAELMSQQLPGHEENPFGFMHLRLWRPAVHRNL